MTELPLNDPRWTATHVSIEQRKQQTGHLGLAVLDTEQSWASDKVRVMRRNRHTGEAEFVPASFCKDHFIGYVSPTSVIVYRQTDIDRHRIDEYGNLVAEPLDDWVFFVWQPDLDHLWPTKQPRTARRRKTRKPAAGGAPPKFTTDQQQWLREKYGSDLKAEPRLAKHDAAVPHVRDLAKTKFGIEAGRNTLLQQVIRPVLRVAKNNQ